MSRLIDLTGLQFGELTVLDQAPEEKKSKPKWVCQCSCGATISARGDHLTRGETKSCGHLRAEASEKKVDDLAGRQFGELTVTGRAPAQKGSRPRWACQCSCGNMAVVTGRLLKRGDTRSCGHLRSEEGKKRLDDLTGRKYGELMVLGRAPVEKGRGPKWVCQCSCGKKKDVVGQHLKRGHTRSCGHLVSEEGKKRLDDLTGRQFGKLTVIKRAPNAGKHVRWHCVCECGRTTVVMASNLHRQHWCRHCWNKFQVSDLTGQQFGHWTVVKLASRRKKKGRSATWLCKCDCGKLRTVRAFSLRLGESKSCGCLGASGQPGLNNGGSGWVDATEVFRQAGATTVRLKILASSRLKEGRESGAIPASPLGQPIHVGYRRLPWRYEPQAAVSYIRNDPAPQEDVVSPAEEATQQEARGHGRSEKMERNKPARDKHKIWQGWHEEEGLGYKRIANRWQETTGEEVSSDTVKKAIKRMVQGGNS